MAVCAMLVSWIVDDPLPRAEAVEQRSRLLEGEVTQGMPRRRARFSHLQRDAGQSGLLTDDALRCENLIRDAR